jgi:hypothetical protein
LNIFFNIFFIPNIAEKSLYNAEERALEDEK